MLLSVSVILMLITHLKATSFLFIIIQHSDVYETDSFFFYVVYIYFKTLWNLQKYYKDSAEFMCAPQPTSYRINFISVIHLSQLRIQYLMLIWYKAFNLFRFHFVLLSFLQHSDHSQNIILYFGVISFHTPRHGFLSLPLYFFLLVSKLLFLLMCFEIHIGKDSEKIL